MKNVIGSVIGHAKPLVTGRFCSLRRRIGWLGAALAVELSLKNPAV